MTEKEYQEATAFLLKHGDAGYDDPLDNFPLPPDVKAARERLREEVAARGYPMTREEVRAAVLADRAASARYFGWVDDTEAAAAESISESITPKGIGETIYVRGQVYTVMYDLDAITGSYAVWFPDIEGCYTCGDTLAHARAMAQERLEIYLDDQSKD